jgi:hypothetical protein
MNPTTVNLVPQTSNSVTPVATTSPQITNQLPIPIPPPTPSQYPMTRILDGDTVVVMTVQQGKDMNRKFVAFKEDIRKAHNTIDTLTTSNQFLSDFSNAIWVKNKDYETEVKTLKDKNILLNTKNTALTDTIKAMNLRLDFERVKIDMSKADVQNKFDLYKTSMEMRIEDYKYKLEREDKHLKYATTRSFIEGGLIVAVLGLAADMVHTYYLKK